MNKVTASWIFNRLCDEPDRLRNQLVADMNLTISRGTLAYPALVQAFIRYKEILKAEQVAAEIKLESEVDLVIVNDHKYVKVHE